jgi:hypothetical protein
MLALYTVCSALSAGRELELGFHDKGSKQPQRHFLPIQLRGGPGRPTELKKIFPEKCGKLFFGAGKDKDFEGGGHPSAQGETAN